MRHKKKRLRLNRFTSWRKATLISLARALLIHQTIRTTLVKAKAVKPLAEKLISLGKKNSLSAKRRAYQILGEHRLVNLLFKDIAPRFMNRVGGYTKILELGLRRGDNAKLALLSFTEVKIKEKRPKKIKSEERARVEEKKPEIAKEELAQEKEKKTKIETAVKEKPPVIKKPMKNFLGGLRKIFKKERDSL